MKKSIPIYCISGLGANASVFANIAVPNATLNYLPWLEPKENETLAAYATRMASGISHENPVVLGVSFGGIVAQEIAAQRTVAQLFLVSTLCDPNEMPLHLAAFKKIPLYKALPDTVLMPILEQGIQQFGFMNKKLVAHFRNMLREQSPTYYRWAFDQILKWKGNKSNTPMQRFHGTKDKLFPIQKIKPPFETVEGTHLIIYTKGKALTKLIATTLENCDFTPKET